MDTSSKKNSHLFHKTPARPVRRQSLKVGCPSPEEARPCCGELKVEGLGVVYMLTSFQIKFS